MENQYFRHVPLAKLIKQRALELQKSVRQYSQLEYPDLYLFVLTNYELEFAKGTAFNTYCMLAELGQQQLMPNMLKRLSKISKDTIDTIFTMADKEHIDNIPDVKELPDPEKYDVDSKDKKERPFNLHDIPNLKVVIGALYTDSTKQENENIFSPTTQTVHRGVTVHSKLLIVDDIFVSLGSANINARSFYTDSEANISIPDPELAYSMRSKLWLAHTRRSIDNPKANSCNTIKCDAKSNFEHWNMLMNKNWRRKAKNDPLISHLVRFWDDESNSFYVYD